MTSRNHSGIDYSTLSIFAVLCMLLCAGSTTLAQGVISLPQTGQTRCYDTAGAGISCEGTGQDGDIRAGVAWPNPRFTSGTGAESECMIDNLTGLMWPKNGNLAGGAMNWDAAIDYANNLTLCGHSDWRLPNINELESLANAGVPNTGAWLNTVGLYNVQSYYYWSSSTHADYTDRAWNVVMLNGYVGADYKDYTTYYVWPVRAITSPPALLWKTGQTTSYRSGDDGDLERGIPWPGSRFTDHGNGAVTDNLTGLIWTESANTPGPTVCTPGTYKTWQGALDHVSCLNANVYLGYTDWRLPNRKELISLVDRSEYGPALSLGHAFDNVQEYYWSSTTSVYDIIGAWVVGMWGGYVFAGNKVNFGSVYVWPVRGGLINPTLLFLSGTVKDVTSNAPLSGVTVSLDNGSSVVTDAGGYYSFSSLAPGTYTVGVSASGYSAYQKSLTLSASSIFLPILLTKNGTVYGGNTQSGYGPDPVNTATGNYIYNKKEIEMPGRGIPFAFERFYNSQDSVDGPLGFGWGHTYNTKLTVNGDSTVTIRWGDGKTETWTPNGAGGFTAQYGVFDTLTDNLNGTYTLKKKDLTSYNFNTAGMLLTIVDKNSNTITMTYTGTNLTQVTDTSGRNIAFTYNGSNRITQITDPIARTIHFTYDANGDLITATDMNGNVTTYTYDADHQILAVVDPRGNTIVTNVYDTASRVVTSQRDAKLGQTTYTYDTTNHRTTFTGPLGNATVHTHDELLRLIQETDALGNSAYYTYDAAGNRTAVQDKKGSVTTYTYDARGNVLTKTDPLSHVTTITYDANNNPLTRTDALGGVTTFTYDANSNLLTSTDPLSHITTITYNAYGQPLTITDPRSSVTTNTYDASGNLTQVTNALSGITTYTYDNVGRKLTITDALSRVTTYTYDNNNNLLTVTNPLSHVVSATYDGNNNKITETDARGNTTTYAYDVKDLLTTITDPLGRSITYGYDALDRRTSLQDKRGNTTTYTYDAVGNRLSVTDPLSHATSFTYDANGNKLTETNPLSQVTTYIYDALNRITSVRDALNNTTASAYDALGRITSTTNAKGQLTSFQYNANGKLLTVTDPNGGTVTYTYDGNGNRLTMTDTRGKVTSYTYDVLNRLIQKMEPIGGSYLYAYDAVGNLATLRDQKLNTITYTYNGANRLTNITYPSGTPVTHTYDANGNRTQMTDSLGTSTFIYDSLNRMTSYTNPYGKTLGYAYDENGNRTTLTYPDLKTVTYQYDSANRLTSATDWNTRATTYTYNNANALTGMTNSNSTTASYTYDTAGRLTALTNRKSDTSVIASYAYTLDQIGNHLSVTQTEPLTPTRTVKNITSTYDDENRLTTVGGITFTYDANGNITNASGTETYTNTFDYNDKLINTTMSGITTQYGYDGTGNRLSKTVNSVTTRYVIDVNRSLPTVIAETDSANTITAFYVHGNGLISKVLPDTTTYCYHYDSRGSTIALTDATQTVTDAYAYDTFGNINTKSGSTANPFSYLGRYGIIDDGNGLYNIRARYYDPDTGRFITKDPLTGKDSDTQSLNRYVYALNNPIRLIDVSGFSAGEGGAGQNNFETSDELHRAIVDRRIRMAKLNSLKAQYDYVAALETEAAYWDATVNTLEGVYGALNTVGGLLTGSGSSVASGLVTMGGAFSQAAGMDQGWHTAANLVSTGLDVYGLSSSANKFYKALDGRTAQAAALGLDIATDLTGNVTKTATEAVKMGGGVISTVKGYGVMLWENLF